MVIITTVTKIFKKVLTIGTPPDDDVLYSKIVKRKIPDKSAEALVVEDFKNAIHHVKSKILNHTPPTEEEKGTVETAASKVTTTKRSTSSGKTKTDKKTSTKNTTAAKSKTGTSEKASAKKASVKKDTGTKTKTKKKITTAKSTENTAKTATSKKKKAASTKKPAAGKAVTKSTKKEAKIALYTKDIKKHYGKVDESFLTIIVKNLGPSIYRKDAELVSCSDPKELDTVRRNFLVKKLGLELTKEELDAAIQEVCQELKNTRTKYRATFYYRLAQKFKKESVLS